MERLTKKINGVWDVPFRDENGKFISTPRVIARLAAYEDTGLEPEDVEEAKEDIGRMAIELAYYHKAASEGRLLVLSGIKNHANDIRQMSDEELADLLMEVHWTTFPPKIGWLDWLKQEVESDA